MSAQTVDFQLIKQAASVENVIRFLRLTLRQHGDTWRGRCHLCRNGDDRAFVITGSKRLFHCFKCKKGGDMLKLVELTKEIPVRDAAIELGKFCGVELVPSGNSRQVPGTSSGTVPPSPERKGFDAEKYATGLDPAHASLDPLGVSAETFRRGRRGTPLPGSIAGVSRFQCVVETARYRLLRPRDNRGAATGFDLPERRRAERAHLRSRSSEGRRVDSRSRSARRAEGIRERHRERGELSHRGHLERAASVPERAHGREAH